ncbi:DNA-binding response regulator [Vibrio inusitatus NBRC 102082]|uniref:DNA-binding response regulator n=1 Tax=Vibrio inusitatus NBRC 102082 TaxID=1219070 RepID=A0A4Y3HSD4_9VIBR|nr:response regulator [Vibrio inusitatus]GEA49680.1 DNA-binding response regulator [Vibrio inusitatus NBRC 102082]
MNKQILVVDDHDDIRTLLGRYLSQHDYTVVEANGGDEMRAAIAKQKFDLVILDIMMPGDDGLTLCKELQEKKSTPFIFLTAMSEDADTVVGLELGADDYLTKPFSPRVLLARVKAVLRRVEKSADVEMPKQQSSMIKFAGWQLDIHQHQLTRDDGLLVALSAAEFRLLKAFLAHERQVLSRDQLMDLTKGAEANPFDRSIDNQISRLRKKVELDPKSPTLIKTVWGGGYMFTEKVES